jgi:hypothetical protein
MLLLRKHFGFGHAARTMARLLLLENSRTPRNGRIMRMMARAMGLGMLAPLKPVPCIPGTAAPRADR